MLFSILIANYNNGKYFNDCYNSLIAQTYHNWEAVIVDDRSTDGSVEVISSLIKDDARFRLYFNDENKGCGYTKHKCAELAGGGICGFVDPDDTIEEDALEIMVNAHKENEHASLIHSTFYYCNEDLNNPVVYNIAGAVDVNNSFTNLEGKVTAFASYKTYCYKQTVGLDPALLRAVDQDLYLKLAEKGAFFFIARPLYKYRVHTKGIATANVDKAFYWFLKVIAKAEERRGVNLEDDIAKYLNRTSPHNMEFNLANPRYLLLKLMSSFKRKPVAFLKRLFINK